MKPLILVAMLVLAACSSAPPLAEENASGFVRGQGPAGPTGRH